MTDSNKAVIVGASVALTNEDTNLQYTGSTNESGSYYVSHVPPGNYHMSVEKQGFEKLIRRNIVLHVQDVVELNLALSVGSVNTSVTVESAVPGVQLETSTIEAVVNSRTVRDLPLNGRDWTQLAALQPGVEAVTTQRPANATTPRGNRGFGQQMTISGTRPQLNNYLLDGISIVDYAGGSPGGVTGLAVGVDAISEFSVVTANASAEYGRNSGGVINAISRSGTNRIHGAVYEFLRNNAFDARNFFDGPKIPEFRRNQFGGDIGGPIPKVMSFFFFDYEGFRQVLGTSSVSFVPSDSARNGIIYNSSGTACTIGVASPGCNYTNSAGTVGVDPLVQPFFVFYPHANQPSSTPGNTGTYKVVTTETDQDDFYTARIDSKLGSKDSAAGSFFIDKSWNRNPDPLKDALVGNNSNRTMIGLQETHIFTPALLNTVRAGFNRTSAEVAGSLQAFNPAIVDTTYGTLPGLPAPQIKMSGVANFVGGGLGPLTANGFTWNSYQAYDDLVWTRGSHSVKGGFAFEHMQSILVFPGSPGGVFSFSDITTFLTNKPLNFVVNVPGTFSGRYIHQNLFGGYVQDDWRVSTSLSLNLGLRYEMVTVPTEIHNRLATLPTFTSAPPGQVGSPYFHNPNLLNFEPRVGVAWNPYGNGKTAIRAAFGFFDALTLNSEFNDVEEKSAPFTQLYTVSSLAQGTFPTGAAASIVPGVSTSPTKLTWNSIQQNPKRNYIMVWNFNVQQELTPSTTLTLGYVGNHGVHMLDRQSNVNIVLPTSTPEGLLWPKTKGNQSNLLNPLVGAVYGLYWTGSSVYDALEVQVIKNMSHGFQATGSYTWGKNLDSGSATTVGDPYSNSNASLFFFCSRCRRGLSDYNIAQKVVGNYVWDLPKPTTLGAFADYALGGWQWGGIFTAETGVPITPTISGDPLGLVGSSPIDYPTHLTAGGCDHPVNPGNTTHYIKTSCYTVPMATAAIAANCNAFAHVPGSCANLLGNTGRNSVIGPGLMEFDTAVTKNNYLPRISEAMNIQFRAEFFNLLNRANFETPFANAALFNVSGDSIGTAGAITSTSTSAREIQFGMKVIW